jgi:four helix bundle protein
VGSQTFRDVHAWKAAYKMTLEIYAVTKSFPKDEIYGLTSQMKRAAVSVPSNIAEGFGRRSDKEKDQFYAIAHGSLTEVENQLMIAEGVGYIDKSEYDIVQELIIETHKTLYGLRKANRMKGEISG